MTEPLQQLVARVLDADAAKKAKPTSVEAYAEYGQACLELAPVLAVRARDLAEALEKIVAMHPVDSGLRGGDVARAALAAAGVSAEPARCEHEWVDARNEVVKSGELCVKCHAIRAAEPARQEAT